MCVCVRQQKQCASCAKSLSKGLFSRSQWQKGGSRRCVACVQRALDAGVHGAVTVAQHTLSHQLVDGRLHKAPGRRTRDRAIRSNATDAALVAEVMAAFDRLFNLRHDTYDVICRRGREIGVPADLMQAAEHRFLALEQVPAREGCTVCAETLNGKTTFF